MHLLLTGASGYIGTHILAAARARGWTVTILAHRPGPEAPGVRRLPWSLNGPVPDAAFAPFDDAGPVEAVVHLAHQWSVEGEEASDINVIGSHALLAAARTHGVARFVFGSSISARPKALNRYGRVKAAVERQLTGPGEVAARIGLVYGGSRQAMWGTLCRIAGLAPVVPMLTPWREVQPVHLDDLCEGLLRLAGAPAPGAGPFVLGDPDPVPFGRFLALLARHLHGRPLLVVPLPLTPILLLLRLVNAIPFLPNIERERVLGLAGITVVPSRDSLTRLGLTLRPLAAALAAERPDRRRVLLLEARTLLTYVLEAPPRPGLIRRYVRAAKAYGSAVPLPLPAPATRWPALLRLLEPLPGCQSAGARQVRERLHVAALIADASPEGAAKTFAYAPEGAGRALLRLGTAGALEALALPVRWLLSALVWR